VSSLGTARPLACTRRVLQCLIIATVVSGCSTGTIANAPSPPGAKAPVAFALNLSALHGYVPQSSAVVTAQTLARQEHDQSIVGALQREGFQGGASNQFADPGTTAPTTAFAEVISQALFFTSASGAEGYFTDEMRRQRRQPPPPSGSTTQLALPGDERVDQAAGLAASAPAGTGGGVPVRTYFVLLRRGRVVAAVIALGDAAVATEQAFTVLIGAQVTLLQFSPD